MLLQEIVQARVGVFTHIDPKTPEAFATQKNVGFDWKSTKIYIKNGKEVKLKRSDGELPDNNGVCLFSEHVFVFCFDPFSCKHTIR